jgi:Cu/Ag efflux protein CusF
VPAEAGTHVSIANTRGHGDGSLLHVVENDGRAHGAFAFHAAWRLPLCLISTSEEGTTMFKALTFAVVLSAGAASVFAQAQNPPPIQKQNTHKATFTVTAIDQATREITLKAENGDQDTFTVGPAVQRFNQLKVGDKISATYTESLVFEVRKPGSPAATSGTTTVAGERYKNQTGGAVGAAHTVSVTVKSIDPNAPSITVTAADGRTMTRMIQDKKNLQGVNVGDRIDITYSEALIVTADPAK